MWRVLPAAGRTLRAARLRAAQAEVNE